MITLYGSVTPNVTKVTLLLEETGLDYELVSVALIKGEQHEEPFRSVSLNGKVPALVDHDGPGGKPLAVFESGAILIYLAEKTGKFLPPVGAPERYETLQWVLWQMAGLGPMFGQYNHFRLYAPKDNTYAAARYFTETMRLFQVMENRLAEHAYLAGATYSIADMAAFPWAALHDRLGLPWDRFTHLPRWREAIAARPATQRAYAAEAPLMPGAIAAMREATEIEKDRFFGRVPDRAFVPPT